MSYDITIGKYDFNYTFNVSRLFYDHIPDAGKGGGLRELNGVKGKEAQKILFEFFRNVEETKRRCSSEAEFQNRYDAPNGWGSTIGALILMARILSICALHPRHVVHVSM